MRLKILLIVPPLLTLSTALFAKNVIDSIGVENQNGKKVIIHKVEPKETYYAIGRRYNVNPNTVLNFNNRVPLQPGATVKVPTELPFTEPAKAGAEVQTGAQTTQEYKVSPGETLYAISRRFSVLVDDIKAANGLTSNNLQPGQILHIKSGGAPATPVKVVAAEPKPVQQEAPPVKPIVATPPPVVEQQPVKTAPASTNLTVQDYKVSNGETLYAIAKRFNTTIEDIKTLNDLHSDNLTPGRILKVRSGGTTAAQQATPPIQQPPVSTYRPEPVLARRDSTHVAVADSSATKPSATTKFGLNEKNERGVATWLDDSNGLDPNKKLILHRSAPIGTVIKITNPMSNRTTYAKVVGRFNENESTKDVIIVMTKNVAESLGALDKRFHVILSYGVPNE